MSAVAEHLEHAGHAAHGAVKDAGHAAHHHAGNAVKGAGNIFRKQLGPLPLGGWLAVSVVGIGLGLYAKRALAPSAEPVTAATDPTAAADPGGTASSGLPAGYSDPVVVTVPVPAAPKPAPSTIPVIRPVIPMPTRGATLPVIVASRPPAPMPRPAPAPTTTSPGFTHSYTIKSGDTLSKIGAATHHTAAALYTANAAVLDAAARKHGHTSSNHGSLIYAGTVIHV